MFDVSTPLPTLENGAPAIPSQSPAISPNTPDNEPSGQPDVGKQAGIFETVRKHAHSAYDKTVEIVSRGRGRPRKDGSPKANDIVREDAPETASLPVGGVPAVAVPSISTGLIKRCLSGILKGLLAVPNAKLAERAIAKGKTESEASRLIGQCAPSDEEIDGLSEFAGILLEKYKVDTKFAPEVACAAIAAGIGLRYMAAFQTLNRFSDVPKP